MTQAVPTLKQVVEGTDTRPGRLFDLCIQAMIVVSLVAFSVETLPDLAPSVLVWLRRLEVVTVLVFTVEYGMRLYVARPRRDYVLSFFGLADLAAIMPFYIGAGVDLRSLRAFRLVRLVRVFKLVRYSAALTRLHRALLIAKEEIILYLGAGAILLYLSAVGIYYFERDAQPEAFASVFHCLWWAVTTLTTVGYGDIYPVTTGGRIFTFFVLLIGLGVVAVPAGLVASSLSRARELEDPKGRLTLDAASPRPADGKPSGDPPASSGETGRHSGQRPSGMSRPSN